MGALAFLFSFHGTSGRRAALMVWLAAVIVFVAMGVLAQVAPMQLRYIFPVAALVGAAQLAVGARRLHHAGYTGRWAALTLLPVLGLLAGLVIALLPQKRTRIIAHNSARAAGYGVMALLLVVGVLRVWWTPYSIPSESMKPTLLVGDYTLLRAGHGAQVQRGDVVVVRRVDGSAMVKRVLALGGDTLELRSGVVWLNGAALVQLPIGEFTEIMRPEGPEGQRPRCANGLVGDGAPCRKTLLREVLPDGRAYLIANIANGAAGDDFPLTTVPDGALFLLGDNRDNSLDSRFDVGVGGLGMVAQGAVYGTLRRVAFSAAGQSLLMVWTWRADRIWAQVI